MVTVSYNPTKTDPVAFQSAIAKLGYIATISSRDQTAMRATKQPSKIIIPDNAPKFFLDAIDRAKALQRPMIIDFWAPWCGACLKLKAETLKHPSIAKVLQEVELIYIDLDKYPALGEAYGVAAIPDVFFVDKNGIIIDRLQNFEPPEAFAVRMQKIVGQSTKRKPIPLKLPQ